MGGGRMRIFVGQRVTGEYPEKPKEFSNKLVFILENNGHSVYCNLFGKGVEGKNQKEQMEKAFSEIDNSEVFLAVIKSDKKSEGMIMEVGYVLAKKKRLIAAVQSEFKSSTYVPEMANELIVFENDEDLFEKLGGIN